MRNQGGKGALVKNASAMMLLQFANYIFPLVLMPFLARQLGIVEYGNIAFCLGVVQVSAVFSDYGFGLSATYRISKWQHRKDYINKLLGAVSVSKLALACAISLGLAAWAMLQGNAHLRWLLLLSIAPVMTQAILPAWLFQGLERMPLIATLTLISRLAYLIPALLFIRDVDDSYIVLIALGAANLLAGLAGLRLAHGLGYSFKWPSFGFALATFKDSTEFFVSRAALSMYTSFGTVFLGMVAGPLQVSIYSVAEQGYKAMQGLVGMASQALYPYMARTKDYGFLLKIIKATVVASIFAVVLGFAFGDRAIALVFGEGFASSFPVLKVFLLVFAVATPSVLLGYPLLGALGRLNLANRSVLLAGALQALLLGLIYTFSEASAVRVAICVLAAELLVLFCRIGWSIKYSAFKRKF